MKVYLDLVWRDYLLIKYLRKNIRNLTKWCLYNYHCVDIDKLYYKYQHAMDLIQCGICIVFTCH